jgi:simple sugar transport system ATP-binding protein
MVHQHFKLVNSFTVLENIILGAETSKFGILKLESARRQIMELSKKYKLEIDPDAITERISVGMQQRVEILKMLYRENELLIFDEPTAMLTPQEAEELIVIMKNLAAEGKSILFITHKLNEIKNAADRCTVLRRGKNAGSVDAAQVSKEKLSEMMIGRNINFSVKKIDQSPGDVILKVENLTVKNQNRRKALVDNVSFEVRAGEIVCLAGVDGNGQQELIYTLTGLIKPDAGHIYLEKKEITYNNLRSRELAHIPENRHKHGLVLEFNLAYNLVLHNYSLPRFQKYGFIKNKEIYSFTESLIKNFDIRSGQGARTITGSLSGGNQQKAVIAREISRESRLLIAVQPARGLDAGACTEIHKQLITQRSKGRGVLLVSLELDEVMSLSDRILVMFEGKIAADVKPNDVSLQELGLYMSGSLSTS